MARMTLDQLLRQNIIGGDIWNPLSKQVGISDWQYSGGGMNEGGSALETGIADPSKLAALQGYTFDWQDTGPENTGTLVAYDPSGNPVGTFDQKDQSFGSALAEWAALAGAGFGGLGLAGLGPLGGALGGAGGAAAGGTSAGAVDAAALGLDAGLSAGATGSGITGGAGLTAGGISGAGITAPALGGSAGLGAGLGVAGGAGAAGAAGAGAAGGGMLASLGGVKGLLPIGASLLGTGLQLNAAGKARDDMQAATTAANDLQRYIYDTTRADNKVALDARNSGLLGLQALLANPSSITSTPGYQFGFDQGNKALNNGAAARGMSQSGAADKARIRYGQDFAGSKLNESANRLMLLASGGQPGASQIGASGANYAGQVGNALMQQGDANAMLRMGRSNTAADAINGLTAYGIRKNWWGD